MTEWVTIAISIAGIAGTLIGAFGGVFLAHHLATRRYEQESKRERESAYDKLLREVCDNLGYVTHMQSRFRQAGLPHADLYDQFVTDVVGVGFSVFRRSAYDTAPRLTNGVQRKIGAFYDRLTNLEQNGRRCMVQLPGPARLVTAMPSPPGMPSLQGLVANEIPRLSNIVNDAVNDGNAAFDSLNSFIQSSQEPSPSSHL